MIYKANYNALLPEPEVKEPIDEKDFNKYDGETEFDYAAEIRAYNNWLSSKIEVVGEHKWVDGQSVVEGVDYTLGKCKCKIGDDCPYESGKWLSPCKVAIPIKQIMNQEKNESYENA